MRGLAPERTAGIHMDGIVMKYVIFWSILLFTGQYTDRLLGNQKSV
jgi:hypothetical protein